MLSSKQKEAVKAVLYYQPTDDELMAHNGKDRVRDNRNNTTVGNASTHKADVMDYKIDKVCDATDNAKEIMDIVDQGINTKLKITGKKLAELNGVTPSAISIAKKFKSYGWRCHLRTYHIEEIAALAEA
jgi:hypothetical protein